MVFRIILFCSMLALGASTGFPPGGAPIVLHLVPHAYKPVAAPPVAPPVAPAPAPPVGEPSPFAFMYSAVSGKGAHQRSESADPSGKVSGSYSLTHKDGKQRKVDYTASKSGFSALIHTNEQGIKPGENPADVQIIALEGAAQIPKVGVVGATGPAEAPSSPFSFMYTAAAGAGSSSRSESGDSSGNVKGTYSLDDEDGRKRIVDYTAGTEGFMAKIQTNEPGIVPGANPNNVEILSIPGVAAIPAAVPAPAAPVAGPAAPTAAVSGPPSPFSFMYTAAAGAGSSSRSESGDSSGNVIGTYSLDDEDGRKRIVDYTAGTEGFMAKIQTNEPGIVPGANPNNVEILSIPGEAAIPAAVPAPAAPTAPVSGPSPFSFMYTAAAGKGSSSRSESGDAGAKIKGSYSLKHPSGHQRIVAYSANGEGFMASVKSNEPGVEPGADTADVKYLPLPEVAVAAPAPAPAQKPISAKELFAAAKYAPVSPAKLANYIWYPTAIVIDQ
ncbi:trans-splicing factor Raa3, chloroplastic-like [Limulus polyphemus]|uniref:Trans-splicing factor Raa3, chloroplastic-like n=1 Tax=Limulus polyphemus TaxID=6850 RepID=A0ABM1B2H3_LIMPO|nr:trans-splicing factor Raa3, chloroplastic-like [Limulus polyphemus]